VAVRRYCARKFRAWNKLARKIKAAQHVFTTCFWPYYVWRRWAAKRVKARNKAKLLKRVWHSYFKVSVSDRAKCTGCRRNLLTQTNLNNHYAAEAPRRLEAVCPGGSGKEKGVLRDEDETRPQEIGSDFEQMAPVRTEKGRL